MSAKKTSISCETASKFHNWKPSKRRCFAASPIDTARPQGNQRLETRRVGAAKRTFRGRLLRILILCIASNQNQRFPIGVFLGASKFATSESMFRARLPSIFITSHKMPRLYHGICTLSPPDAALTMRCAKNTQHDTSKVLRLPRQMTMDTSKVLRLPRKLQHIF